MTSVPIDLLRSAELFAALDPGDAAALAALAREAVFRKGDAVFHEKDVAGSLYLILSGVVEIARPTPGGGAAVRLARLERGEVLGELAFFDGGPRSASAHAVATPEARLAVWEGEAFRRFLQERPQAGLKILGALCVQMGRRLRRTSEVVQTLLRAF
jgi:CRP/FNR family cyclic AMP-dependent transcriptional regulator